MGGSGHLILSSGGGESEFFILGGWGVGSKWCGRAWGLAGPPEEFLVAHSLRQRELSTLVVRIFFKLARLLSPTRTCLHVCRCLEIAMVLMGAYGYLWTSVKYLVDIHTYRLRTLRTALDFFFP